MNDVWTVLRILDWTRGYLEGQGSATPRLDAELLLARVLGLDRIGLYTAYDRPLTGEERDAYRVLVKRRGTGEPTQYILGEQEFWSLRFRVEAGVLIPRPETELLVEEAVAEARRLLLSGSEALRVADVGTGTGCVAVAIASEVPEASIVASDIAQVPLALARGNAEAHGVAERIEVLEQNGLEDANLATGPFDLIVSNPPYISDGAFPGLMPSVRDFEPRVALTAGPDGLDVIRPLVKRAAAPDVLSPNGALLLEISDAAQASRVEALCREAGFARVRIRLDYSGVPRVVVATRGIG